MAGVGLQPAARHDRFTISTVNSSVINVSIIIVVVPIIINKNLSLDLLSSYDAWEAASSLGRPILLSELY